MNGGPPRSALVTFVPQSGFGAAIWATNDEAGNGKQLPATGILYAANPIWFHFTIGRYAAPYVPGGAGRPGAEPGAIAGSNVFLYGDRNG
jgi:hypothetical protein